MHIDRLLIVDLVRHDEKEPPGLVYHRGERCREVGVEVAKVILRSRCRETHVVLCGILVVRRIDRVVVLCCLISQGLLESDVPGLSTEYERQRVFIDNQDTYQLDFQASTAIGNGKQRGLQLTMYFSGSSSS